ncbi:peptidoglycan-binding protein [Streptomyces sp. CB09001]|nr:peptidoglycan-binding protein [Streptomyces sp. CB09001]
MKKRWKIGLAALASGMATVLAVVPAQAAYSQNSGAYGTSFVDGAGSLTDDFGDHFDELGNSLCNGCGESSNTDIVMLWQSILVSEHLLDFQDVDGYFGSQTKAATIKWQQRHGLDDDGMVGDATWSKADDRLRWSGSSVRYSSGGPFGFVEFHRGDSSKYHDGGAYHLHKIMQGDGVYVFETGTRVYHRSKTVSHY